MKKVFSAILIILLLLLILPYIAIAEYNNRVKELESQVLILQMELLETQKQIRVNTQDIEILNNIIYEKDFVKRLD